MAFNVMSDISHRKSRLSNSDGLFSGWDQSRWRNNCPGSEDNTVHEQQVMQDWEALSVAKHTHVRLCFSTAAGSLQCSAHFLTF